MGQVTKLKLVMFAAPAKEVRAIYMHGDKLIITNQLSITTIGRPPQKKNPNVITLLLSRAWITAS